MQAKKLAEVPSFRVRWRTSGLQSFPLCRQRYAGVYRDGLRPMPTKPLRIGPLLIFGTLSFLDLALTYHLLQRGGGHVYESNPVANAWLSNYGWAGLALFKLLTMGLVIVVAVVLSARRPRAANSILTFACSTVALVVVYSCSLAGFFGEKV